LNHDTKPAWFNQPRSAGQRDILKIRDAVRNDQVDARKDHARGFIGSCAIMIRRTRSGAPIKSSRPGGEIAVPWIRRHAPEVRRTPSTIPRTLPAPCLVERNDDSSIGQPPVRSASASTYNATKSLRAAETVAGDPHAKIAAVAQYGVLTRQFLQIRQDHF
jgi:hypothetical protein